MQARSNKNKFLVRGASGLALAIAMFQAEVALAQAVPIPGEEQVETTNQPTAAEDSEIVVTGSRIARAGFDLPTPTTVIGEVELRQGSRPNLQQVLNDAPSFRPTVTPQVSPGNTSSGSAPVDLRGLGSSRTLTLVNGRRFVGNNNLNYIPLGLVERVEVVTGGASAAYGSDAVAGVVNIILKNKVKGINVGGVTGISSRGDGMRYGFDLTAGTEFAGGKGQILFSGEYVNDKSIPSRNSRANLTAGRIIFPGDTLQTLVADVNTNQTLGGLIVSGVLANQTFDASGNLRPYQGGVAVNAGQVVGGVDSRGLYDAIVLTTPLERISTYGRATYDFGGVTLWADAAYGRSRSDYPFLPDIGIGTLTLQSSNPFLPAGARAQLAAAGQPTFRFARFYDGPYRLNFDGLRQQYEGAVGIDAELGSGWKFTSHFSHGVVDFRQRLDNARVVARFNNAINAVSSGGQIVCGINADAITTNDDPACRPLNLFGDNASPEAIAYAYDTQRSDSTNKLDAASAQVQGDLFSLWAGPVTVALGAEARWEKQKARSGALDLARAFGPLNLFGSPISGGFNVKEGFGEVAVPLLNIEGKAKIDLNGAARYSDYSQSGGIWSWKAGGTIGLFDTLLLRGTRSRDIRAPGVGELFAVRALTIRPIDDAQFAQFQGRPGYNRTPSPSTFTGGNPDLVPEVSYTTTVGATFSPRFFPGFNLSVDYYDIKIGGAIFALTGTNLTVACNQGSAAACDRIVRDPVTGTVTQISANQQNIASFETAGVDIEASYLLRLSRFTNAIPGTIQIRGLASYVDSFVFDTGSSRIDSVGSVGAGTSNAIPKWRSTLSLTYQGDVIGLDARIRHVGGGKFDRLLEGVLSNNDISSRTYVDLGAQFKVSDRFTFFTNANNVFDRKPPISPVSPTFYDVVGTYYTAGARVKF